MYSNKQMALCKKQVLSALPCHKNVKTTIDISSNWLEFILLVFQVVLSPS
jgi:hypothetical protein